MRQKDGESRKEYLVRVAIEYIRNAEEHGFEIPYITYDDAECDGYCLADDLEEEFRLTN